MLKYKYLNVRMPPADQLYRAHDEVNKWGREGWRVVAVPMNNGIYAVMEITYS